MSQSARITGTHYHAQLLWLILNLKISGHQNMRILKRVSRSLHILKNTLDTISRYFTSAPRWNLILPVWILPLLVHLILWWSEEFWGGAVQGVYSYPTADSLAILRKGLLFSPVISSWIGKMLPLWKVSDSRYDLSLFVSFPRLEVLASQWNPCITFCNFSLTIYGDNYIKRSRMSKPFLCSARH